jgi:hypothetical protein
MPSGTVVIKVGAEAEAPDLLRLSCRFMCNVPLLGYAALMPVELKARSRAGKGLRPFFPCLIENFRSDTYVRGG